MTTEAHKSLKIFCSYSHRDEEHVNELRDWLRGLERQGLIEWWHDREISPGWEWDETIDKHLRSADVILLFVTYAFMASDYVYEQEIGRAVERHERGEARVIPIMVRPADWEWASFGKLQALPKDAKPITTWANQDEAWLDVVRGVRKAVKELLVKRQERAAKERYRKAVEETWTDNKINDTEAERLSALASELTLSTDTAAGIERDVMDETKEAILEHQEQAAREKERQERLDELYARVRRLHQNQNWRAVLNVFEQIRAEDPVYPDPEGLLTSARVALEITQKKEDALREYREGVKSAWRDAELDRSEVATLRDLTDKLEVSPSDTAKIEREVMGDTKEAIFESQERAAREQYRKALEQAWKDNWVSEEQAEQLSALASELGLSRDAATDIEHRVMGDTIEAILEHQEQTAREEERRKRLGKLYDRARQSHRDQEWQAVVDLFAQIHAEDPAYPDPEGLLRSANEALQRARSAAIEEEPDATEVARQKAQELGVDLSQLEGSGAGGRITIKDVVSAAPQKLRGAFLQEVDLTGALLQQADLRGALLKEADLRGADLREIDLTRADFTGADLTGADLRGAYRITQDQIESTIGSSKTRLPERLNRPESWS